MMGFILDVTRGFVVVVSEASTVMIERLSAQQSEELEELREAARLNEVALEKAEVRAPPFPPSPNLVIGGDRGGNAT